MSVKCEACKALLSCSCYNQHDLLWRAVSFEKCSEQTCFGPLNAYQDDRRLADHMWEKSRSLLKIEVPFSWMACLRLVGHNYPAPGASASWNLSEKPRIRWGYTVRSPSRSAFSRAPQKLVLVDFGREEYSYQRSTIDTEIKAKRNNMISEWVTFRLTKAKSKVKFGVKYLCEHECERSSVRLISIWKRKRKDIFKKLISL